MKKIYMGADHAGTHTKESIKKALRADGYIVEDFSPSMPEGGDDYPDYAFRVAEAVVQDEQSFGILVCDTGIGMAIAANKVRGASAALVSNTFGARRAREHNDVRILVLGNELTPVPQAMELIHVFLTTPFTHAERHVRRLGKIQYYDAHRQKPEKL